MMVNVLLYFAKIKSATSQYFNHSAVKMSKLWFFAQNLYKVCLIFRYLQVKTKFPFYGRFSGSF